MPGFPHQLVLREGWEAVLPQGLLGEVWGVLPRMFSADDRARHGEFIPPSLPPLLSEFIGSASGSLWPFTFCIPVSRDLSLYLFSHLTDDFRTY